MATVLLVDDNLSILDVTKELLEFCGAEVFLAHNGEEALALLTLGGFDLVVTDIQMPGMNGNQLMQRIRASYPDLPVVAHTASPHHCIYNGFNEILTKPTDLQALRQTLLRYSKRSTQELRAVG